ncbi:MAG: hypothetical protein HYU87_00885 [Chloroflexi bacterium]|nr:hypothetical protein [Chloroflexota bacterium]
MSAEQVQAIVDRAIAEAPFRELLSRDPATALAEYDLTPDERARFGSGTARAERLEPRVSRNDLSAALGVKTGTVDIRPPSKTLRPER